MSWRRQTLFTDTSKAGVPNLATQPSPGELFEKTLQCLGPIPDQETLGVEPGHVSSS